jgi:hypothetical protein
MQDREASADHGDGGFDTEGADCSGQFIDVRDAKDIGEDAAWGACCVEMGWFTDEDYASGA